MSEETKNTNTETAQAPAAIELSYRKGKKGFTIFVHQHNDKKIAVQRWYSGN